VRASRRGAESGACLRATCARAPALAVAGPARCYPDQGLLPVCHPFSHATHSGSRAHSGGRAVERTRPMWQDLQHVPKRSTRRVASASAAPNGHVDRPDVISSAIKAFLALLITSPALESQAGIEIPTNAPARVNAPPLEPTPAEMLTTTWVAQPSCDKRLPSHPGRCNSRISKTFVSCRGSLGAAVTSPWCSRGRAI
jgi:hypothetical protein